MNKVSKIDIQKSSGNVFEDLGLPNAEEHLAKAKIAYQINQLIKKKGLKQKQAAELLSVDQPKISALSKGQLKGFSIERLFKFLAALDQDVEIIIKPHKIKSNRGKAQLTSSHLYVKYADI